MLWGGADRIFIQCEKSTYKKELSSLKFKRIYKQELEIIKRNIECIIRFIDNGRIEKLILSCLKENKELKEQLEYEVLTIKNNAPYILES